MLKIAIVGDYTSSKRFVEYKYKDKITKINLMKNTYILSNGDEIFLCYGEPDKYKSMEFDAYMVVSIPETLEDVIKARCIRP